MRLKNYQKARYVYYSAVAVLVLLSTFLSEIMFSCEPNNYFTFGDSLNQGNNGKHSESQNSGSTNTNHPGITANAAVSEVTSSRIPVLMYHHIKTNTDPSNKIEAGLDLPPEQFEQEMASLNQKGYQTLNISQLFQTDQENKIVLTFDDGYKDIITNAYPILHKYNYTATVYIISDFAGRDDYLNWDDIRTLKNSGWEIGSHTVSHYDLTRIPLDQAQSEITQSKAKIETELGITISSFCYPSGKYNADIIKLVQQAGYQNSTTTKAGRSNAQQSAFELKRVRIGGSETIEHFNKAF